MHVDSCEEDDLKLLVAYDVFEEADYGHLDMITKGRVLMCSGGLYHMVCGEAWDSDAATVVCRQLGFSQYGMYSYCVHFKTVIIRYLT